MKQLLLQGYGYSGVSFLRDFFKEIEGAYVFNYEFDLLRKSGGIMDLLTTLSLNNPFLDDCVIRRFSDFYNYLYKNANWKSELSDKFLEISKNLEEELIMYIQDFPTRGFAVQESIKFPKDKFYFHKKFKEKIIDLNHDKDVYFIKNFSEDKYKVLLKEYMTNVLSLFPECEYLALVHPLQISMKIKSWLYFFENYRVITISRDPRDVFVDMNFMHDEFKFTEYYKKFRRYDSVNNEECGNSILNIRFEDFVLDYNKVEKQILDFCGIEFSKHNKRQTISNPEVSKNNIGLYKTFSNQKAISYIEKELSEYCYE